MDAIINFIIQNADHAHLIIFALLVIAGVNFPVSEDILIIIGGMLSSTLLPEKTIQFFVWIYLGCYCSDMLAYWLGRLFGESILMRFKSFVRLKNRGYLASINVFYERYGFLALILGRFIPFGVRNGLFITAGMSRMSFIKFIIIDAFGCLMSNSVIFYLAYRFGQDYQTLFGYLRVCNFAVIALVLVILFSLIIFLLYRRKIRQIAQ